jgi:hypothetical protein
MVRTSTIHLYTSTDTTQVYNLELHISPGLINPMLFSFADRIVHLGRVDPVGSSGALLSPVAKEGVVND